VIPTAARSIQKENINK